MIHSNLASQIVTARQLLENPHLKTLDTLTEPCGNDMHAILDRLSQQKGYTNWESMWQCYSGSLPAAITPDQLLESCARLPLDLFTDVWNTGTAGNEVAPYDWTAADRMIGWWVNKTGQKAEGFQVHYIEHIAGVPHMVSTCWEEQPMSLPAWIHETGAGPSFSLSSAVAGNVIITFLKTRAGDKHYRYADLAAGAGPDTQAWAQYDICEDGIEEWRLLSGGIYLWRVLPATARHIREVCQAA